MAVRIRKLAKELRRTPAEVIGILHALGLSRYKSPDDMLPPDAVKRLRGGVRRGVRPTPASGPAQAPPSGTSEAGARSLEDTIPQTGRDIMAELVPGVVPVGGPKPSAAAARPAAAAVARGHDDEPRLAPPTRDEAPPARPRGFGLGRVSDAERAMLDSERRALRSDAARIATERESLAARQAELDAQERALEAERHALSQLRQALEREREALDAERVSLEQAWNRAASTRGEPLQDRLEARGLLGADEIERAIGALAQARLLRDVLWTLQVSQPAAFDKVLRERMVLVASPPPSNLPRGVAAVAVADARAELPNAASCERLLARLGEALMQRGLRRVLLFGGAPSMQRLLRDGLDARIELTVLPGDERSVGLLAIEAQRADVLVCWGAVPDPDGLPPRLARVDVGSSRLAELVEAVAAI